MRLHALLLLSALFLSYACDEENKKRMLPAHTGASGEVILVMQEELWLGAEGDSLRSVLEAYVPAVPQAEPSFNLRQFAPHEMNSMLRQHRNIIDITIGPDGNDNPGITVTKDKWSSHQLVFTVNAPSPEYFYDLVATQFSRMAAIINQTEQDRLVSKYKRVNNRGIQELIAEKFGVTVPIPDDCKVAKETENFIWVKRERVKYVGNTGHEITQGFFVYAYPYKSQADLLPQNIMAVRDSVLKRHVPGPENGTYMTTEYLYEPESEVIEKNSRYTVLLKGLWKTENYFMGGPFRSLTTLSNDNQYIVSVSGFVFAPRFDKREYIREVEAILSAVSFSVD